MTIKYLITTSIFSLTLVSVVQAADISIPEQRSPVVVTPTFSWTGFYLGGQIGSFSSKTGASYLADEATKKWIPIQKEFLPKLSGFIGGIYAGSNIDIDGGFILGIDTDIMWSDKKDTKEISSSDIEPPEIKVPEAKLKRVAFGGGEGPSVSVRDEGVSTIEPIKVKHTLKQKWFGATRVKMGFSVDRMMPYVAGGVAYTQIQNIFAGADDSSVKNREIDFAEFLQDEKKTMVGYTIGGGVDFAMTDHIMMRAEYRYSDFGKKKFVHDKVEMRYKTNDFRVGVAYKF